MKWSTTGDDTKMNMTPYSPCGNYQFATLNGVPFGVFTLFGVSALAGAAMTYSPPSKAFINLIIEAVKWAINQVLKYCTEYAFEWFKIRWKEKKDKDSLEKMAAQGKGYDSINETIRSQYNLRTFMRTFTFQTECEGVATSYKMKKAIVTKVDEDRTMKNWVFYNLGLYGVLPDTIFRAFTLEERDVLGDRSGGVTTSAQSVIDKAGDLLKEVTSFSSTVAMSSNSKDMYLKARRYAMLVNADSTKMLNQCLNVEVGYHHDARNGAIAYQRIAAMSIRNSVSHLILDREINKRFPTEFGCWGSNQALIESVENTYRSEQWMAMINEAADPVPLAIDWARINGYRMAFIKEEILNNELTALAFSALILNELDSPFVRNCTNSIAQLKVG